MEAERRNQALHANGCVRGQRQHPRLRNPSGRLADREADLAALDFNVEDLVVEGLDAEIEGGEVRFAVGEQT